MGGSISIFNKWMVKKLSNDIWGDGMDLQPETVNIDYATVSDVD